MVADRRARRGTGRENACSELGGRRQKNAAGCRSTLTACSFVRVDGMFGTVEAEIAAENQHKTNVIDERNLEKYHDQLSSFNTQATLVLGFAVASLNADNLFALGDDQSKYCLYKPERMAWGYVFGLSTCLSISTSLTCIAASFYLIVRSQHFALNVSYPTPSLPLPAPSLHAYVPWR